MKQLFAYNPITETMIQTEVKQVALTFDDGPHKQYTEKLLDGLKERQVHATFFLMGEMIAGKEDLVIRMKEEGHLIGNHSYQHAQLSKIPEEKVWESIYQTSDLIESITTYRPEFFRPPYGEWSTSLEEDSDMTMVLWDIDSLDWKLQNTQQIVNRVVKDVEDGDIILMHDIFQTSVEAALAIIDVLHKEGYEFVTVDELMID